MFELPMYLVANERPLINFDSTLLINIGLWLALFFVLRGLLWEPMLKLIAAREGGTEGSREQARTLQHEAKKLRDEFEGKLREAKVSATAERDKLRSEAQQREAKILAEARTKVTAALDAQRGELSRQRATLSKELGATVPVLAAQIASKVLGREVQS